MNVESLVICLALNTFAIAQTNLDTPTLTSQPAHNIVTPHSTLLRFATSADGLTFADTGDALIQGAAAPDLVRLPSGNLLAIFDCAPSSRHADRMLMAVCRSSDDGRTWSAPRPVRLRGGGSNGLHGGHGDLLVMPDGRLRLYFSTRVQQRAVGSDR